MYMRYSIYPGWLPLCRIQGVFLKSFGAIQAEACACFPYQMSNFEGSSAEGKHPVTFLAEKKYDFVISKGQRSVFGRFWPVVPEKKTAFCKTDFLCEFNLRLFLITRRTARFFGGTCPMFHYGNDETSRLIWLVSTKFFRSPGWGHASKLQLPDGHPSCWGANRLTIQLSQLF